MDASQQQPDEGLLRGAPPTRRGFMGAPARAPRDVTTIHCYHCVMVFWGDRRYANRAEHERETHNAR